MTKKIEALKCGAIPLVYNPAGCYQGYEIIHNRIKQLNPLGEIQGDFCMQNFAAKLVDFCRKK